MAPKKAKKKKTKAEIEAEKLAQAEEDRKMREIEMKRSAEEVERKRLEDLKIQGERAVARINELSRLNLEHLKFLDDQQSRDQQMNAEETAERESMAWAKFRDPTDEPNAEDERDMNTFLSLISETVSDSLIENMQSAYKIEVVARAVEDVLSESIGKLDYAAIERCQSYLTRFYDLIVDKIDGATAHILRFVDKHLNERYEINVEEVQGGVCVGIWGSFAEARPTRKAITFEKTGVQIDVQKQILMNEARFVFRMIRMPIDKYSPSVYREEGLAASLADGKSRKYVLGDLFILDFLCSPPSSFSIRSKRWTIRDRSVLSMKVRKSPYPSTTATCRCAFRVADEVLMGDDVRMAVWNPETLSWSEDGISEYQFNEQTRLATFYISVVGTFAFVRDRNADLPYKKWHLCPLRDYSLLRTKATPNGPAVTAPVAPAGGSTDGGLFSPDTSIVSGTPAGIDAIPEEASPALMTGTSPTTYERLARLTIATQRIELVIEICGTKCKLTRPPLKQLASILNVEMSPGCLLYKLQRRGVNLIPTEMEFLDVGEDHAAKVASFERDAILNISRCANACEFISNSWNQQLGEGEIGLCVKESTVYTGGIESFDYECVFVQMDSVSTSHRHAPLLPLLPSPSIKYWLVLGNEYGDKQEFSLVPRPGEESHLELSVALAGRLTTEATERIERVNERFARTVFMLLRILRPFSLS